MGFCKNCNKEIEDGIELCDECNIYSNDDKDESYLDNLLNSVINSNSDKDYHIEDEVDQENIFDSMSELESEQEDVFDSIGEPESEQEDIFDFMNETESDNIFEGIEDDNIFEDMAEEDVKESEDSSEEIHTDSMIPDDISDIMPDIGDMLFESDDNGDYENSEINTAADDDLSDILSMDSLNIEEPSDEDNINIQPDMNEVNDMDIDFSSIDNEITGEDNTASDDTVGSFEEDELNDILSGVLLDDDPILDSGNETDAYDSGGDLGLDDDLMKMLNESANSTETGNDMMDFEDMLNNASGDSEDNDVDDMSGVMFDESLLDEIPDINEKKKKKSKKAKKDKAEKAEKNKEDSIWFKLFANVKTDEADRPKPSKKKDKEEKEDKEETEEPELTKEEKKELKKKEKEEKKKEKEEKKKAKKGKGSEEGEAEEGSEDASSEGDKKAKKDKKDKTKKQPEVVEDEYEGEINKVGAAIVLLFFAAIGAAIIMGTNVFSYNLSVHRASGHFDNKKYTMAYEELSGIELKESDMEIFNKVKAVMLVNRQYDSYVNYMQLKRYPEALDALIRGFERYDTVINEYQDLGIEKDVDYVKETIVNTLESVFNISEKAARKIAAIEDKELYSERIIKVTDRVKN